MATVLGWGVDQTRSGDLALRFARGCVSCEDLDRSYLSQAQLATLGGSIATRSLISENGRRDPRLSTIRKLAGALRARCSRNCWVNLLRNPAWLGRVSI